MEIPDSRWFDVAALTTALVVLTGVFDRFERHKPAWRRLAKIVVLVTLVLVVIESLGRVWGYAVLGLLLAAGMWLHFTVLSRLGISGWTGEPRDRFEALLREIEAKGERRTLLSVVRSRRRSAP
jgi:hypothetical protein